ncbi:Cys-tRNA(Pro) deacylase [Motiliproteus coralliicola]|uniref:Cys-tRNA(Pro)/Cys-tRNA(Cys) deacylase n=1 Tax=Motiliproteus coralliicola TaxID=2283196 RepID=A0A369WAW4_9GAMM|nr:Cys-tRNA(Pro) deacylase [Motiliproteus coralliicola]RDE18797.1 Cys-tRNA(Pro) deacylase [Motiliproteus coralliicola]
MTPAVNCAKKAKISFRTHSYQHDPNTASYGDEAAQALGIDPQRVFKTLLVSLDGNPKKLAVGVVPVSGSLDLKAIGTCLKSKKVAMADPAEAQRATGYLLGGISPLGQKKRLPLILDQSAKSLETIHVSGGKRGLEIELAPADLLRLTGGQYGDIGRG